MLFQVYNTILRRFPTKEYKAYADGGNLFSTTIAVVAPSLPLSLERCNAFEKERNLSDLLSPSLPPSLPLSLPPSLPLSLSPSLARSLARPLALGSSLSPLGLFRAHALSLASSLARSRDKSLEVFCVLPSHAHAFEKERDLSATPGGCRY